MATRLRRARTASTATDAESAAPHYCESSGQQQVVLVLQGGGALGAYQVGVYQALHEAGIEPDWVIGTSIGAINAALIAGNPRDQRLARLQQFWDHMELRWPATSALAAMGLANLFPTP
jgi:NTE family protein